MTIYTVNVSLDNMHEDSLMEFIKYIHSHGWLIEEICYTQNRTK